MSTNPPMVAVTGQSGPGARVLYDPPRTGGIVLDTAAWWSWLDEPTSNRFSYPVFDPTVGYTDGFMTVRKDRRQRGGWYWSVYRRSGGHIRRIYLGRSAALTQDRLEAIAQTFWRSHALDLDESNG
jgi:hypothetical protein